MKISTLVLILLSIFALFLGTGYYIFREACRRKPALPWGDPQALQSTMWAPIADRIHDSFVWLEKHHAQDVWITSDEGLHLHGLWVPTVDSVGTILLFHGYGGCPQGDFSVVMDFYRNLGFNLLMPDQRCHGKSQGKYITFGVRERLDALRWIAWHNASFGCQDLYLGGISMGASTVMMAAGEDLPPNVRGITADCGFTSPAEIIAKEVRHRTHLPPWLLMWSAEIFARLLGKFSLWECSTLDAAKKCTVPVLFLHGTGDRFVPCDMTQRTYAVCAGEKELILVEGAGHGLSYVVDQPRCQSALENFFLGHLSGNPG